MTPPFPERLRAATTTGTPVLTVIDFSLGGLLVQASEAFEIGSVVHLTLSAGEEAPVGSFALRCLHAHRTSTSSRTESHISALVFVYPPDERTAALLSRLGQSRPLDGSPVNGSGLRLARSRSD
jgi:hypothetical protein